MIQSIRLPMGHDFGANVRACYISARAIMRDNPSTTTLMVLNAHRDIKERSIGNKNGSRCIIISANEFDEARINEFDFFVYERGALDILDKVKKTLDII